MTTIGYLRVSTDEQDLLQQEHLLLKHAQKNHMQIDRFIRVEVSTRKSLRERRIEELLESVSGGDTVIVAELSRLGRNMFQTLDLINKMSEMGVKIVFVRQPELSTTGSHAKLLLAIYSYFAEAERDFISMRTKQEWHPRGPKESTSGDRRVAEIKIAPWTLIVNRFANTYSCNFLFGGFTSSLIPNWRSRSAILPIAISCGRMTNCLLFGGHSH